MPTESLPPASRHCRASYKPLLTITHKSFDWVDIQYQASFVIDPLLVSRSGWYINHLWTCELQLAVRRSEYDLRRRCYEDTREAGTLQKRKVTLEPCTLETSSLEEWTLEEFNSLWLFLCDLDWFARSSSIVVSLARKDKIGDKCTKHSTKNVSLHTKCSICYKKLKITYCLWAQIM